MTYTIQSAVFSNRDHTAAIVQTKEAGAVAVSEFDTPDYWTKVLASGPAAYGLPTEELALTIKGECQRRIYAVVDQIAQVNLAAAAAGGVLTPGQMDVYRSGLAWIASMRTRCGELIVGNNQTFSEDRHWPVPTVEVVALAHAF